VRVVPKSGGTPAIFASEPSRSLGIALDAVNVYFVEGALPPAGVDGTVLQAPKAGGSVVTLAAPQNSSPQFVAVDTASVYVTDAYGRVITVPIGGGSVTTLASNMPTPTAIAVDATDAYWVNATNQMNANASGTIMRVSK